MLIFYIDAKKIKLMRKFIYEAEFLEHKIFGEENKLNINKVPNPS